MDGGHLPDSGFFDPTQRDLSTPATDIFSLGSILYVILTGHWPYKLPGTFKTVEEMDEYGQNVGALFKQGKFPDVGGLVGRQTIRSCWTKKYSSATQILRDLETEMLIDDKEIQGGISASVEERQAEIQNSNLQAILSTSDYTFKSTTGICNSQKDSA